MLNLNNKNAVTIGVIVAVMIMLPYIILGEDAFITIHDFLDSNPVHAKTLISLNLVGNPEGVLPILDGVSSLNYMPLIPIDIKNILYLIMPFYWAIICNMLFVKIMAFWGMFLLCSNYILKGNLLYSLLVSVLFCLVPFYADYGLSSAGVPLFLYCVLNLENRRNLWQSYVLIAFFACNSALALVGIFLCVFWGAWICLKWFLKRKIPTLHIYGMLILVVVYLFANFSIVFNYFFSAGFISHRVEFSQTNTLLEDIQAVINIFLFSQGHAGSFYAFLFVSFSFLIFIKKGIDDKSYRNLFILLFILEVFILLGTLIKHLPIKLFVSYQFDRFYFLYPTICFVLFAKSLSFFSNKKKYVILFSSFILLGMCKNDGGVFQNVLRIIGVGKMDQPSFRQFFDTSLFTKIKNDLKIKDDYSTKVVSLGMHPSIAEYNRFYTVDSYVFSYSLAYKHKFRKVIEEELEKDNALKSYYDDWGSRCYMFSSELGTKYLFDKNSKKSVKSLDINVGELRNMGCDYILSSVGIRNYRQLGLSMIGDYTSPDSYWRIKVYKIG